MSPKKKRFRIELWSMIFFLLPFAFALSIQMWVGAVLILASVSTSIVYHITENLIIFYIDRLCAIALIVLCWVAAILGHFPYPFFPITLMLGAIALGIYFNQEHPPSSYPVKHAVWHTLSAFVVTLSLMMYIIGR